MSYDSTNFCSKYSNSISVNQQKAFCHKAFGCSIYHANMEQTMSYKRTLIYDDLVDLLDDVVVVDVLDHDNSSINSTRAAVTAIDAMKPKPSAAPVLVAVADNAPNTMTTMSRAMIRAIMARLAYSRRR